MAAKVLGGLLTGNAPVPQPAGYTAPAPYQSPGAYVSPGTYVNPGQAISGPTSSAYNPQTASQTMAAANQAGAALPTDLQISNANSVLSPEARKQYEDLYYNQYVKPGLAQTQANLYGNGQANSTFGGAVLGSALAQGAATKMFAGEDLYNSRLQNLLNERQSFFSGEGQMAQNANNNQMQNSQFNASLGMQNAGMLNNYNLQNSQNQNSFNLGSSQNQNSFNLGSAGLANQYSLGAAGMQNSFNLGNFNNQMSAYNAQQAQNASTANGLLKGAAGVGAGVIQGGKALGLW